LNIVLPVDVVARNSGDEGDGGIDLRCCDSINDRLKQKQQSSGMPFTAAVAHRHVDNWNLRSKRQAFSCL
jgi:hypothetical protein